MEPIIEGLMLLKIEYLISQNGAFWSMIEVEYFSSVVEEGQHPHDLPYKEIINISCTHAVEGQHPHDLILTGTTCTTLIPHKGCEFPQGHPRLSSRHIAS